MSLKIIPLGGLGEIGLNMLVFEYGDTIFIVDAGLMFPEDYMLGIDIVIPVIDYITANRSKISGIVLTHAHEDHIGALPYILREVNVPVFGTPYTLGIVKHKLVERGLYAQTKLHVVTPEETLNIGPFSLEFINVSHSVLGNVGIAIRTPVGLVVHTGDFRIGYSDMDGLATDVNKFAKYGDEGILALLSDSTNVESEGYTISGRKISETLANIFTQSNGRIIVALFASNVIRVRRIIEIANQQGRKIVINGKSIETSVSIAKKLDFLKIPRDMEIGINEIDDYPDDEVVIITTGSQGEPMSSLARMASGAHKQLKIKDNDTVILSSKIIPGNEKPIANIINNLYRRGANVIYEKISEVHASGHAFQEELKLMINLTKPKFFIPIHGEFRHLTLHGRLAKKMGIPDENIILAENGQVVEIEEDDFLISGSVPSGRLLVDGKGIGDVGICVLKERRILSEEGFVAVNIAFDEETGYVVFGPEINSRGLLFETARGHLLVDAQCVILEIIEEIPPEVPNRMKRLEDRMKTALRQYFFYTIGRKPVILPFLIEVN